MKQVLKSGFILLLFVLINLHFSIHTQANQVGFSVDPIFPSNQIDKESGYFHIQLKPGNKQQLNVEVKNYTDKEIFLKTGVSSATTNINGVVDYTKTTNIVDDSLPVDLSEHVTLDEKIQLAPHETKRMPIFVSMTSEYIPGVIASGISFEEIDSSDKKVLTKDTTVNNHFSYVLALIMQQQPTLDAQPEINLKKVEATDINTKTSITGFIRNVSSVYLNQVSVQTTITKKNESHPFLTYKKENMQMAPNSVFEFPTFLKGKKLESGKYTYKAVVSGMTAELNKEERQKLEWVLEDDFEVKKQQAKQLNELDDLVEDTTESSNKWLIIVIVLNIVLILSFIGYILVKRKQPNTK